MVTALLMASCFVMGVLFVVIASWMQTLGFRRAAAANLAAALCCVLSGAALPLGQPALPSAVLVAATLLGISSMRAVRVGRG